MSRWAARHGLDRVPFLLNVLRGEMALVGPEPEREDLALRWKGGIPEYERRFSVLPGVTGLAQVSGATNSDFEGVTRRVLFDLHYIENRSLLLDTRTLFRTLGVIWRVPRRPVPTPLAGVADRAISETPSAVKGVTR